MVCWTAYPVAFGSITSTLDAPLLIAAIGIIFRGASYALRGQGESRAAEILFAVSSVLTPFALGTVVGAIATGRVPVGNAAGNLVTSWLNPASVLTGALAVVFCGYLAAVYLAADSLRYSERTLATAFRHRALAAGLASGALALAGLFVMRHSGLNLTRGPAPVAMLCVSAVGGLATLALCWRWRFGLARLTAALAVAAVVVGWAAAQAPRFLPGMTVTQAAAGRSALVALLIGVACGSVVLIPSLALLFTLFLRGRLDTPEHPGPASPEAIPADATALSHGTTAVSGTVGIPGTASPPCSAASPGTAFSPGTALSPETVASPGTSPPRHHVSARRRALFERRPLPRHRDVAGQRVFSECRPVARQRAALDRGLLERRCRPREPPPRVRLWGEAAIFGLVGGAGLLVFANPAWAHGIGVASLILCAVAVFHLATAPPPAPPAR